VSLFSWLTPYVHMFRPSVLCVISIWRSLAEHYLESNLRRMHSSEKRAKRKDWDLFTHEGMVASEKFFRKLT